MARVVEVHVGMGRNFCKGTVLINEKLHYIERLLSLGSIASI